MTTRSPASRGSGAGTGSAVVTEGTLARLLANAAAQRFPPADGRVEVLPPPTGRCDAIVTFTGHAAVAADVPEDWVRVHLLENLLGEHEHHPALGPMFLAALADRLGTPPAGISMLLAAPSGIAPRSGEFANGGHDPEGWADYRWGVRNFHYCGRRGDGAISLGRGPAGRLDVWCDAERATGGRPRPYSTLGRELLLAARSLVPQGASVFASMPVHSARWIRTAMAAGFRPVGAEVLFCTRPAG